MSKYEDMVRYNNPVSYWRFDEASGAGTAVDVMGNYNLTYIGSPTIGVGPAVFDGTAVTFNGSTQLAERSTPPFSKANDWSLEAWVRSGNVSQAGAIISNGSDARGYCMIQAASDGTGNPGSSLMALRNGAGWMDTGWDFTDTTRFYHIVMTCDTSNITRVYVDSVLQFTSGAFSYNAPFTDHHTTVGAQYQGDNTNKFRFFNGTIDEPALYAHALSQTEITNNYNFGRPAMFYTESPELTVVTSMVPY